MAQYNYDDFVHDVKQKLQACHEVARANLMKSKQQRVAQHAKVKMPIFHKGDKVLLRNEKAGKSSSLWEGPYTIYELDPNGINVIIEISRKKNKSSCESVESVSC